MKSGLIAIFLLLGTVLSTRSGELPRREEERMDSMIRRELSARAFPGAAFLCGTADQTLYTHNYGDLDYTHTVPVTDSTLYDVASCTKVLSTTFVLMRLYDQKKNTPGANRRGVPAPICRDTSHNAHHTGTADAHIGIKTDRRLSRSDQTGPRRETVQRPP